MTISALNITTNNTWVYAIRSGIDSMAVSFCCWVWMDSNPSVSQGQVITLADSGSNFEGMWTNYDATPGVETASLVGGDVSTLGPSQTFGTWHHYAYVQDAGTQRGYVDGVLTVTQSGCNTFAPTGFEIGRGLTNSTQHLYGSIANARAWSAALSTAEIYAESRSATPVRTTSLVGDWPLNGNLTDTTGIGDLVPAATVSYVTLPAWGATSVTTLTRTASPVTLSTTSPGDQFLRPVSDVSAGAWTTNTGAATNLYATLNEIAADDTTYVQSPGGPTTLPFTIRLGAASAPGPGNRILRIRLFDDVPGGTVNYTYELMQGSTVLQVLGPFGKSDSTATEIAVAVTATITDWTTPFDVRVTANQVAVPMTVPPSVMAYNSDRSGHNEIYEYNSTAGTTVQLTNNAAYDSFWPRISPTHTKFLFYRTPAGVFDTDPSQNQLWTMNRDGSSPALVIGAGANGWVEHGHAEWWPDGSMFLMQGGPGVPQIFLTNLTGGVVAQLTARAGTSVDPSPAADMTRIVFCGIPDGSTNVSTNSELFLYTIGSGIISRITNDLVSANDPYFSPDGTKIAWLCLVDPTANGGAGRWGVYLTNADGSGPTSVVIDDGQINSRAVWSPDGQWLYFHRIVVSPPGKWDIYKIRPDGSQMTLVTVGQAGNNFYPGAYDPW